jgi:hypothetical protein
MFRMATFFIFFSAGATASLTPASEIAPVARSGSGDDLAFHRNRVDLQPISRRPGATSRSRVEIAARHTLPHHTGRDRHERDLIAPLRSAGLVSKGSSGYFNNMPPSTTTT